MKKRASLLAILLAASLSFTSVVPALAVEVPAGEVEAVDEQAETETGAEAESEPEVEADSAEAESESMSDTEPAVKSSEEAEVDTESEDEAESGVEEDAKEEVETESVEEAAEEAVNEADQPAENDDTASDETESGNTDPMEIVGPIIGEPRMETYVPGDTDGQSSDDLFAAYVDKAFGGADTAKKFRGGGYAGARLTGANRAIYNYIAAEIPAIASGERASTTFEIDAEEIGVKKKWTAQDLGVDAIFVNGDIPDEIIDTFENATMQYSIPAVNKALLSDYPFHMYWYDKTSGVSYSYGFPWTAGYDYDLGEYAIVITGPLTIRFFVSIDFDVEGAEFTVDTNVGQSVQVSVNNANAIVSKYSSSDDRAKLRGYLDDICDLVSYNDAAAGGGFSYGNPWQMIWVFDGDPGTKVVCEGYSKAFKYLCDQSDFQSDIRCITVSGTMGGGTGAGAHMWNVVRMDDGRNYVVDVTNCDTGTVGWPDQLFLATATYTSNYSYDCACNSGAITYSYNAETIGIYDESELLISSQSLCNHSWGTTYVVDQPATCTEEGSESIHCTVCGEVKPGSERAIEATGHSYGDWEVTVQPGCVTEGSRKKICSVCSDEIEETISALGHSMEKTEAEPATCTSDGHVEYWTCSRCGKLYLDSEGADEVSIDETIIHAAGHNWNTEYTVDKEATCTEEGSESIHCLVCGESDENTTRVILKKDHAYGDWTVTKEATCTEAGSEKKVCAACGDEVTEEIPATGHDWLEWTVIREATEEEEGLERRTCSNDPSHTEEKTIPKLSHVHELIRTDAKEASCTEDGNVEFWTCSDCGRVYSDSEGLNEIDPEETVIHAAGHKWNTEYTVDKEATCTEEGSESIHCSVCGVSDENSVQVIHATGHAYGDWTVTKEATCTESGSREKVCANCGDKITEEIPASGHQWNENYTVDKDPTYTEEGVESIHCSVCGEIQEGSERAVAKLRKPVSMLTISGIAAKNYNGKAQTQAVVVMDGDTTLVNGTDYTLSYKNNTNAGTASVIITGIGSYTGSVTKEFTIKKIANTITAKSFTRTYSTKAQSFDLGVKIKSGTPTYKSSSSSVTVSKAGKVTVKAKFMGKVTITITAPASTNYTATTKKITVTVNPTKTALSSVSSPSAGKMTVKWKKNAVGTGYQIQYSTSSKFTSPKTVTVTKNTTLSKTIGSLAKGKKYYVRIRTYKTVGSTKFYSGWSAAKAVTIRK